MNYDEQPMIASDRHGVYYNRAMQDDQRKRHFLIKHQIKSAFLALIHDLIRDYRVSEDVSGLLDYAEVHHTQTYKGQINRRKALDKLLIDGPMSKFDANKVSFENDPAPVQVYTVWLRVSRWFRADGLNEIKKRANKLRAEIDKHLGDEGCCNVLVIREGSTLFPFDDSERMVKLRNSHIVGGPFMATAFEKMIEKDGDEEAFIYWTFPRLIESLQEKLRRHGVHRYDLGERRWDSSDGARRPCLYLHSDEDFVMARMLVS